MFNHVDISLPQLERETIDGVRYYKVPDEELLRTGFHHFGNQSF
jgi:hypothetical protein